MMKSEEIKGADLTVNIKGINICYDDFGSSEIPIIFIHGFPFSKSSWNAQTQFLKNYFRVIAYDIRGFGNSESGGEKFSIDLFADDLIEFMNILKIRKAIVCGLSMGGYILLNAISRYPDRFKAIILSDTQCVADTEEGKAKRLQTIAELEDGGIMNFAEGFTKAVFTEASVKTKQEMVAQILNTILSTKLTSLSQTLLALAQRDETCTTLTRIKIPALILCGEEDVVTKPAQSEALHKGIENSEFHLIPEAGHMSHLEQAEIFNQHIQGFISGAQN